jgi:predicted NBD/HSP70 family sugar kinase
MSIGLKQTTVRDKNLELTLDLLREQNLSSSELAKILHLSKQALSKITDDLLSLNLIKVTDEAPVSNKRGRKKVNFCINENVGLLATIVFHAVTCEVSVFNAKGTMLKNSVLADCEMLTPQHLEIITEMLSDLLKDTSLPLLYIVIAVPGEISKFDSSIKASTKFNECAGINLVEYYGSRFNCPVDVKNDINLMMLGERTYGDLKDVDNALMLYIDSGVGGAICYNGEIFDGDNGYAAEFGFIKVMKNGKKVNVEQLFSINFLKREIREHKDFDKLGLPGKFRYRDIVQLFNQGNEIIKEIILSSCVHVAMLVENLFYIFDIKNIHITGRIAVLGEQYINRIREELGELQNVIKLDYSSLGIKGIELGALKCALDKSFINIIEYRNVKN